MTLAVNLDQASVPIETIWAEIVDGVRREYLSEKQSYPWIIGFSGGKDSTVVVHALFEALLDVAPSRRMRPAYKNASGSGRSAIRKAIESAIANDTGQQ